MRWRRAHAKLTTLARGRLRGVAAARMTGFQGSSPAAAGKTRLWQGMRQGKARAGNGRWGGASAPCCCACSSAVAARTRMPSGALLKPVHVHTCAFKARAQELALGEARVASLAHGLRMRECLCFCLLRAHLHLPALLRRVL